MTPRQHTDIVYGNQRIVITGTGAVCSVGNSVREIWDALICGKSGIKAIEGFDASGFGRIRCAQALNVPGIKTNIHPRLAKSMGKYLTLLLLSAEEAYHHAGLGAKAVEGEETGFFAAIGMGGFQVDDFISCVLKSRSPNGELDYNMFFSGGYLEIYPLALLAVLNNVVFCQVAIHLGVRGENCVFAPHADAGIQAIAEAAKVLREGKAKAALVSGVGEEISPISLARGRLNGLLGGDELVESPFLGECGASLVLEPIDLAMQRGAKPLAGIAGFGFACEKSVTESCPTSWAVRAAMEEALLDSGLQPEDIDLVLTGASGNPGIAVCAEAVDKVFGEGHIPPVLSSGRVLGEIFGAEPVLNSIIGSKIFESSIIPSGLYGPAVTDSGRIMTVSTSYEGRCASLIIERVETP
jgi:3-oxoacyl-[acyl-carrier-protein] synthase II